MGTQAYRDVWAVAAARRVLLLGAVVRIPLWAGGVVLTLHVVGHLHRSYAAAGLVVTAATVAVAAGAPWRGRRVDRVGLRAATGPCLLVSAACWACAPFLSYRLLLVLAFLAGLFAVPTFSIVRQALLHAVAPERRRAALSVDSVMVEVSFMVGPPLGVLLAATTATPWALFACEFASIAGGLALWFADPPLRTQDSELGADEAPERADRSTPVPAVLAIAGAAVLVLTGTDVAIVAALRAMGDTRWIGAVFAVWGVGSAVGGLVYGALHRPVPLPVLLALLAGTTPALALAPGPAQLGLLLIVAGLFCAPTITATVEVLSAAVPDHARGEALGRHGTAMTLGAALGAPLAGAAIDHTGWHAGFLLPALIGLVVAATAALATRIRPTNPTPALRTRV